MMDDLHKNLKNKLQAENFDQILIDKITIFCSCTVEGHIIKFRCVLPPAFPYELPTIYIDKETYVPFSPLPHVNPDCSICIFDKTTVIPNFRYPNQIILDSFVQARIVIQQGITKENQKDFLNEFSAYWSIESTGIAESIVSIEDIPKPIKCYWGKGKIYLADNKESLDSFLGNIGIKQRYLKDFYDGIYLPLNIELYPPFPKSNFEMFHAVKSDVVNFEIYNKFLKTKIPKGAIVAFSLLQNGQRHIHLWMHTGISSMVKGFRKHRAPVEIAYLRDTKKSQILKFSVEDLSQKRLYNRGGIGITSGISKVAVIGCGSLGSYLVEAMSEYGISSFILVDNEKLSAENIARHFCGYEYIGYEKATAISQKLHKENPNIHVETFNENAFTFLDNHMDRLNECDIVLVATAYAPLEHKILEFLNLEKLKKTTILTWVEPFLAAGHAIILNKPQNIFQELFDPEFKFSERVLINSEDYLMKEAGCQSTFLPYAAFSLKRYIYTFLDYLIYHNILKKKPGNYLYSWCGDLFSIEKKGGQISSQWANTENYSFRVKRID